VVAAYPSGFADNFLYFEKDEIVEKTTRILPNLILGTNGHVTLSFEVSVVVGSSGLSQSF
jgi:hypothetical protein